MNEDNEKPYKPGSLLPKPKKYTAPFVSAFDYYQDDYYEGFDLNTDVSLFDSSGNVLPYTPYHDYDFLEFEKLKPLSDENWMLFCVVKDVEVFGGICGSCDPDCNWRVCKVIADVFGKPALSNEAANRQE